MVTLSGLRRAVGNSRALDLGGSRHVWLILSREGVQQTGRAGCGPVRSKGLT